MTTLRMALGRGNDLTAEFNGAGTGGGIQMIPDFGYGGAPKANLAEVAAKVTVLRRVHRLVLAGAVPMAVSGATAAPSANPRHTPPPSPQPVSITVLGLGASSYAYGGNASATANAAVAADWAPVFSMVQELPEGQRAEVIGLLEEVRDELSKQRPEPGRVLPRLGALLGVGGKFSLQLLSVLLQHGDKLPGLLTMIATHGPR